MCALSDLNGKPRARRKPDGVPESTIGWPVLTRLSTSFMKSKLRSIVVPCLCISLACSARVEVRWVVRVTPETERVRICRSASGPTVLRISAMHLNGSSPT